MSHDFDAMIVDWMMPNESGIEFIKSVRNSTSHIKNIPAIMLTAMDNIDNKIIGFDSGFDDYITKPFEERELIARLRALINRTQKDQKNKVIQFGDCEFNLETDVLLVNSKEVYLSTTELTLLKTLCQKPNHPFSRMELAKKLTFRVSDRTIDVQITRLRKKIGDNPKNPTIIKTIRYIGYSLVMQPMNFV
jgi:two-component system phosphate regulon response regulator OmpR